jgi:hypothetical protein
MQTFETPEPINVRLELGIGEIRIKASERRTTTVEVKPSDPAKQEDIAAASQTRVEVGPGRLLVKGPKGWRQWSPWSGRESIDVEIELPEGSRVGADAGVVTLRTSGRLGELELSTGVGQVDVDEAGPLKVKTGMGDINVQKATGAIDLKTATGRIEVHVADGNMVVKNSNGDTRIQHASGDLRVQAGNGSISVDATRGQVVTKTAMGDIHLGTVAGGAVDAQTAYGQIDVGILDGVAAWLDLHTAFGQIRNDLDSTDQPPLDETTAEVRAHTAMGNITVRRASAPVLT